MARGPVEYQRAKLAVFAVETVAEFALLAAALYVGAGGRLKAFTEALFGPAALWAYLVIFFHVLFLLTLPSRFYSGYLLEKRFQLSTQRFSGWLTDTFKRYALSLAFFVPTMGALVLFIRALPQFWWIAAAAGWLLLSFVLLRLFPVAIIPLFYKTLPVERGAIRARIEGLCERLGVCVLDVRQILFSAKTKKANAAVVGAGGSRRVLISDTLLQKFTPEEIEMVVAHELGHHLLSHIRRSFLFQGAATTCGFLIMAWLGGAASRSLGAEGLGDLAAFPALVLLGSLGGLLWMPAQNMHSRAMEEEADLFALRAIPDAAVFRSLMDRLAALNLADPSPNPVVEFLFYDHPSISRRIRLAEEHFSKRVHA